MPRRKGLSVWGFGPLGAAQYGMQFPFSLHTVRSCRSLARQSGKWANLSIFDVDRPAELHEILGWLPL